MIYRVILNYYGKNQWDPLRSCNDIFPIPMKFSGFLLHLKIIRFLLDIIILTQKFSLILPTECKFYDQLYEYSQIFPTWKMSFCYFFIVLFIVVLLIYTIMLIIFFLSWCALLPSRSRPEHDFPFSIIVCFKFMHKIKLSIF